MARYTWPAIERQAQYTSTKRCYQKLVQIYVSTTHVAIAIAYVVTLSRVSNAEMLLGVALPKNLTEGAPGQQGFREYKGQYQKLYFGPKKIEKNCQNFFFLTAKCFLTRLF